MKIRILSFLIVSLPWVAVAQGNIQVNLFTGTPDITVSLGSIGGHGLSDNVYLYYNTRGLAVGQREIHYGIGWNLSTYGITREVRGLPDDQSSRGWLFSQNNLNIGNFNPGADNSATTCSDELADYNFINGLGHTKDTEPDIFHYNIPGHGGSFIFDNSATPTVRLIPYDDISIEVKYASNSTIAGFVITTNDGNRHVFNTSAGSSKSTAAAIVSGQTLPVEFQKTNFEYYKTGTTNFKYRWLLDSVKAPNQAWLFYSYQLYLEKEDSPLYYLGNSSSRLSYDYSEGMQPNDRLLQLIRSSSGMEVTFNYNKDILYEVVHTDTRKTGNQIVKRYSLLYDRYHPCPVGCDFSVNGSGAIVEAEFNWPFLKSVRESSSCSTAPPYEFSYITPKKFPQPVDPAVDAWGYYNLNVTRANPLVNLTNTQGKIYVYPQLPAQEQYRIFPIANYGGTVYEISTRSFLPLQDSAKIGALQTIKFPFGGTATLDFELNEFYDPVAQQAYKAGGLRVKSITYFDGIDNTKNIVSNYSYTAANGTSSGKLITQPKFTMPSDEHKTSSNTYLSYQQLVAQGLNPWTYLSRISYLDVTTLNSSNDNTVVYASGKISKPGQGYTITDFTTPGIWGESSSGEWQASTVRIARSSACNSVDFLPTGTFNIYPYPSNPIYTYAQGLPTSVVEYSEQGVRVRETIFTYQDLFKNSSSAFKVWGLRYEKVPYWTDGYLFSKYFLLTEAKKVIATQTTKEYDLSNTSKFVTTVQSYFYTSAAHKLLSRIEQTGTDGSRYKKYFKYPLDFGSISPTAGESALMIKKLQDNFRNGSPVETYTTVTPPGGIEKTISASTSILSAFGSSQPLPKYMLSLKALDITNFAASSIQSGHVTVDLRYDTVTSILSYQPYAIPSSMNGDDRIYHGTVTGYNHTATVAEVSNAVPDQIAFSDFETTTTRSFDISGTLVTGAPRSGYKSIHPIVTLSKTLKKSGDKYVFSGWLLKKQSVVVNLFVKNVGLTQTYHSQTFNFNAGGSAFAYFGVIPG